MEVIPKEETASESVKMSKLCIGLNHTMKPPSNTITGITTTTQSVMNDVIERMQLVTNTTLTITQGKQYTHHALCTYYIAILIQNLYSHAHEHSTQNSWLAIYSYIATITTVLISGRGNFGGELAN